jgi:hypothetical protein
LAITLITFGQIQLENEFQTYHKSFYFDGDSSIKFCYLDNNTLNIRNIDGTNFKQITFDLPSPCSNCLPWEYSMPEYISENIFDTVGSEIEFSINFLTSDAVGNNVVSKTFIYHENGSPIIKIDSTESVKLMIGKDRSVRLIASLRNYNSGGSLFGTKVYKLPGTISDNLPNINGIIPLSNDYLGDIFPNPTNEYAYIPYDTRNNGSGQITIRDSQGKIVENFTVSGKGNLKINTDLDAGFYFYSLIVNDELSSIKKFIIN